MSYTGRCYCGDLKYEFEHFRLFYHLRHVKIFTEMIQKTKFDGQMSIYFRFTQKKNIKFVRSAPPGQGTC